MTPEQAKLMMTIADTLQKTQRDVTTLTQTVYEMQQKAQKPNAIVSRIEHDSAEKVFDIHVRFDNAEAMSDADRKSKTTSFTREFVALCEDYKVHSLRGTYVRSILPQV